MWWKLRNTTFQTPSKEIANFESFTARSIIDLLEKNNASYVLQQLEFHKLKHKTKQDYQLWQEGFHPQAISNEEMFRQKLDYIHHNPVQRGYVDEPSHWRYSSYRNYLELPSLLAVELVDLWGGMLEAEPLEGIPSRSLGTRVNELICEVWGRAFWGHSQPESGNELTVSDLCVIVNETKAVKVSIKLNSSNFSKVTK